MAAVRSPGPTPEARFDRFAVHPRGGGARGAGCAVAGPPWQPAGRSRAGSPAVAYGASRRGRAVRWRRCSIGARCPRSDPVDGAEPPIAPRPERPLLQPADVRAGSRMPRPSAGNAGRGRCRSAPRRSRAAPFERAVDAVARARKPIPG